jgi:hypothetical protein
MEKVYGGCLCYGPPIENGFYYDMFVEGKQVRLENNYSWHYLQSMSYLGQQCRLCLSGNRNEEHCERKAEF